MDGKVWLVGVGPGDPDLITIKGREALERADVVVYDHYVSREFLDFVAEGAEVIYAGSQAGLPRISEDEIDQLMRHKAGEGKRVVRLIGGDPFVFGGGGEIAERLRRAGAPFEVVNGVTSSVAAPSYAGIPITYHGVSASFAVVDGGDSPELGDSPVDWSRLATAVDTIVMVGAVTNLAAVAAALVRHGRAPTTPAAVVSWGVHARQQIVSGTLDDIADQVAASDLTPPAVTVVGDVVRLRERMRWYDERPLFGKRVLVTRSRQQAAPLRRFLREEGATVLELPALELVETAAPEILDRVVAAMADGRYAWAVFTSANAVDLFFRRLDALGRDARVFATTKICAVGTEAAEALPRRGIRPDLVRDETVIERGEALLPEPSVGRRRVFVPRAGTTHPALVSSLRRAGAEVEEVPLYLTAIPREPDRQSLALLRSGEVDIVTFANSTAVTNLLGMLGGDTAPVERTTVACIGPITARTAREAGLTVEVVSEDDTAPGLVAALRRYYRTPAQR
ncbi:MAG: uroporphyrinogen-III C-methyltransferase [Dehalococcoidia bacterium]